MRVRKPSESPFFAQNTPSKEIIHLRASDKSTSVGWLDVSRGCFGYYTNGFVEDIYSVKTSAGRSCGGSPEGVQRQELVTVFSPLSHFP